MLKIEVSTLLAQRFDETVMVNIQEYWTTEKHNLVSLNTEQIERYMKTIFENRGVIGSYLPEWRDKIIPLVIKGITQKVEFEESKHSSVTTHTIQPDSPLL